MYQTLVHIIEDRKKLGKKGVYFINKGNKEEFLSYKELYNNALVVLSNLKRQGVFPGDELVFQIQDSKTFVITFWACILGGIIPVPLTVGLKEEHKKKLFTIWSYLKTPYIISSKEHLNKIESYALSNELGEQFSMIKRNTIEIATIYEEKEISEIYMSQPNDIAFIQFSSGSTGVPKGVMLTHKNVITNIAAIAAAADYTEVDSTLSWMPLTHDMGLIGFHLNPLFSGMNQYLIPTELFVRTPTIWLTKAHEHRITILCSPNFGYKYTIKNCLNIGKYDWDLSSIRLLYNGAEPISEKLAYEFIEKTQLYGLQKCAMRPVYGLAEASLAVSISELLKPMISLTVLRDNLNIGDKVVITDTQKDSISFVNVGKAINNCEINITDKDGVFLEEMYVGHVHIKGDNVTLGYYNNEDATKKIKYDGWIRTGDIGFVKEECLYIVGRSKDIIFLNGQNYYSHDIELVAQELSSIVELNKIAVAGKFNSELQRDETFAFVFHRGALEKFIPIQASLRTHINHHFGFELDHIIPVKDIPRTTSGKIQRYRMIQYYEEGFFKEITEKLKEFTEDNLITHTNNFPQTEIEKDLYIIWREVLNKESFGVTENFFDLGGNSLKAAQVLSKIHGQFYVELDFDILYDKQTISELADLILNSNRTGYTSLKKVLQDEKYLITSTQEQLYYIWKMNPASVAYNIPIAFRVVGVLDIIKFRKSINKVITRHEILRTVFIDEKGTISQKVIPEITIPVTSKVVDKNKIKESLEEEVLPFHLNEGPLIRVVTLNTSDMEHVIFIDMHHSIADGVSISLFLKEVFEDYEGKTLPKINVQYKDYVYWELKNKNTKRLLKQKTYWVDLFKDGVPLLSLPTDISRPSVLNYNGAKLAFELPVNLSEKLKDRASQNKSTLFAVMLGAYAILLSKLSDEKDIVIGVPVANRNHNQTQEMLGMFVNSLATRYLVDGLLTINDFLKQTHQVIKGAIHNQEFRFQDLVQEVEQKRNFSRNSLFDTMFMYQNMELNVSDNFKMERFFFDPKIAKYDISIEIFDQDEIIAYYIEYATSIFKKTSITRIARFYEYILETIVEFPNSKLSELSLVDTVDFNESIIAFNATEETYAKHATLHEYIQEQILRTPEAIAVQSEKGEQLTYLELHEKSEQLAYLLRKKGVDKESPVVVIMDRTPELIISILAILKSGGCYLPIEKESPYERVQYIIKDSRSKHVLINSEEEKSKKLNFEGEIQIIDVAGIKKYKGKVRAVENKSTSDSLAYIIYTSGTTGNPKGVMVEHKSIMNYVCWANKTYLEGEKMNFPLYTSIAFDLTLTSIFVPLISGNTIYTYSSIFSLEDIVAANEVQIIKATPSHLRLMKSLLGDKKSSIKKIIVGGEDFKTSLAKELHILFEENKVKIYNEYGPTEATIGCMIYEYKSNDEELRVPIGQPIANTQIYILDRYKNPLPKGSIGELYVSGDCLARGYLYRPELTEKKYIKNPFIVGQKMYSTGDLAKRLKNGVIEYVGRSDQQVKINGHRIELEEIEKVLLTCQEVEKAIVTIIKEDKEVYLIAYVSINERIKTNEKNVVENLKLFLTKKLPNYMLPRHIITINTIPLTKNGKVNYDVLPKPIIQKNEEKEIPKSKIEADMIEAWENIFSKKNINIHDNFIELGGDSIKAVQIISLLREANIELKVKDILNYQTIAQILANVTIAKVKNEYEQGVISGYFEPSPIQQWFLEQKLVNPNFYNQSVLLEFNQPINKNSVEKILTRLVEHHDGLRLNFDVKLSKMFFNNNFLNKNITITVHEVETLSNDILLKRVAEGLKTSFNIHNTLLIKGAIFKSKEKEALFLTAHHLVIDGVSWRILLDDFKKLYEAEINNKSVKLPKKTASLITYTKGLTTFVNKQLQKDKTFWGKQIINRESIFQEDFVNTKVTLADVKKIKIELEPRYTEFLLKDAHLVYNTTVEILLITALLKAIHKHTGKGLITLEMEHHGRDIENLDISRTVGWFTSLYPLLFQIEQKSVAEQIMSVKDTIKSVSNGGISYGMFKQSQEKKDHPEIRFNYLGQFGREMKNELFSMKPYDLGIESDYNNIFELKLDVNAFIFNNQLVTSIAYTENTFSENDINTIAQNFIKYIHEILSHIKEQDTVYFTPSDFKMAEIDSSDLNTLFN